MSRWLPDEEAALIAIRSQLKDEIALQPPFPEVVGDRRLIRFFRGYKRDIPKAVEAYSKFLKWRRDNNVNEIRQKIIHGGVNSAFKFPNGEKIIGIAKQIVFTANAQDRKGRPLVVETYSFSPKDFSENVTIDEYLVFLIYSLEFRAAALEQISEYREREYLRTTSVEKRKNGYGHIQLLCNIRDLGGVTLAHGGATGRQIVAAALKLGIPNYPEYLGVGYFCNVPWIFSAFWTFVKTFLDEDTLEKLSLSSNDNLKVLQQGIDIENIPVMLGGKFELFNEPFEFDVSEGGPLWCEQVQTSRRAISSPVNSLAHINTHRPKFDNANLNRRGQSIAKAFAYNNPDESQSALETLMQDASTKESTIKEIPKKLNLVAAIKMHIWENAGSIASIVFMVGYVAYFYPERLIVFVLPTIVAVIFSIVV